MTLPSPILSVITPCKGRLEFLKRTAPRLQGIPGLEHVIVDADCPQGAAAWCRENLPSATVVETRKARLFNLGAARNAGLGAATGKWILILDADVILNDPGEFMSWITPLLNEDEFFTASTWDEGRAGILVVPTSKILPRGYTEFEGYGYDDDEMCWYLSKRKGLRPRTMSNRRFRHIPHDRGMCVANYSIGMGESLRRNNGIVARMYADVNVRGDCHWHPEYGPPLPGEPNVGVKYEGRFGNCMFEYAMARVFAEDRDLSMENYFDGDGIVKVEPWRGGRRFEAAQEWVSRNWAPGFPKFPPDGQDRVLFWGFFQHGPWYHDQRDRIEKFFIPEPVPAEEINRRDVLVSLRVDRDYHDIRWVIHPSWYLDILKTQKFDRLHIVADAIDPAILSAFKGYDPIVTAPGPKASWDMLRRFDRVILSNSSFAWWAMFFGHATKIWTFKRWIDRPEVDLSGFPGAIPVDGPFLHELPFSKSV